MCCSNTTPSIDCTSKINLQRFPPIITSVLNTYLVYNHIKTICTILQQLFGHNKRRKLPPPACSWLCLCLWHFLIQPFQQPFSRLTKVLEKNEDSVEMVFLQDESSSCCTLENIYHLRPCCVSNNIVLLCYDDRCKNVQKVERENLLHSSWTEL